jgi:uncharacterized protein DUF4124
MRDLRNAPSTWIRGWVALLAVAGCANVSCALAQIYKCTDADGRTAFSDKPCGTLPSGATGSAGDGVKQDMLRQPKSSAGNVSADSISAMCARPEGSKPSDEAIKSLPDAQRKVVISVLRGMVAGVARDPGGREALQRATLHVDASGTAIICVPWRRADRKETYAAVRVEPNGRTETLQPSQPPIVSNDANEPTTAAARCSSLVMSCVRTQPKTPASIDPCLEKTPVCPGGRLDPAAHCCPQACKDAYRRERAAGTDPESALIKVIFGDDAGAASCIPGMSRRG